MSKKAIYLEFSLLMVEGKKELKAGALEQFQRWLSDNEICVYIIGAEDKNEIEAILTRNGLSKENIEKISIHTTTQMDFNVGFKKDIIHKSLLAENLSDVKECIFYGVGQYECRQILESKSHIKSFNVDLSAYYVDPKGRSFLEGLMQIDLPDENTLKQIYNCLVAVVKCGPMESINFLLNQYCGQNGDIRSIASDLVTFALQAGNYELAHSLLEKFSINIQNISIHSFLEPSSPFFLETSSPFIEGIISFLLLYGIDINQIDSGRGETALCKAVRLVNLPAVKALISAGANVEQCDSCGYSPLYYLATLSNASKLSEAIEIFTCLIQKCSGVDGFQNQHGETLDDLVNNMTFPVGMKITLKDAQLIIDYRAKISDYIRFARAVAEYRSQANLWGMDRNPDFIQKNIDVWQEELQYISTRRDKTIKDAQEEYHSEFNKLFRGNYKALNPLRMQPMFSSPLVTAATSTTTNTIVATTATTDLTYNMPVTTSTTMPSLGP
jgi:hypothetical protein